MPALQIGVQLSCLSRPLKDALLVAKRLNADAVEIDGRIHLPRQHATPSAVRQVRKWLDDLGLKVCALGFATRRGYGDPEQIEARVEATKAAMNLAYQLGSSLVVNQVGRVPSESEGETPSWKLLVEVLTDLAAHAQRAGAHLAAETGSEPGSDLARLLAALPAGSTRVDFNPGNLIINGFSPEEAIEMLGENVAHVHARDGVHDRARGRGKEVALGRGTADFPALMGALEERGYRGCFTVTCEPGPEAIHTLTQGITYLRSL